MCVKMVVVAREVCGGGWVGKGSVWRGEEGLRKSWEGGRGGKERLGKRRVCIVKW